MKKQTYLISETKILYNTWQKSLREVVELALVDSDCYRAQTSGGFNHAKHPISHYKKCGQECERTS